MKLVIKNMENAIVFVHKAPKGRYRHFPHLDALLDPDPKHPEVPKVTEALFDTRKGWSYNVIALGQNVFKGNIRMEIWIDKNFYAPLLPTPEHLIGYEVPGETIEEQRARYDREKKEAEERRNSLIMGASLTTSFNVTYHKSECKKL
jgi:hypothetical protein